MANMLNISAADSPVPLWLNLENVFLLTVTQRPGLVVGRDPVTTHVVAFTEAGGTGQVLPEHLEFEEVLAKMQSPQTVFTM